MSLGCITCLGELCTCAHTSLEADEGAHALVFVVPVEDGLQLPDGHLRVEVGRRRLHPVDVPHEYRVLELDVRLVLVLELLRVERAHARAELQFRNVMRDVTFGFQAFKPVKLAPAQQKVDEGNGYQTKLRHCLQDVSLLTPE